MTRLQNHLRYDIPIDGDIKPNLLTCMLKLQFKEPVLKQIVLVSSMLGLFTVIGSSSGHWAASFLAAIDVSLLLL